MHQDPDFENTVFCEFSQCRCHWLLIVKRKLISKHEKLLAEVNKHIRDGAAYECRLIFDEMLATLPLEIRNQVYGALLGVQTGVGVRQQDVDSPDAVCIDLWAFHNTAKKTLFSITLEKEDCNHLLAESMIPVHVLREIIEHWYFTSRFRFTDASLLAKFLSLQRREPQFCLRSSTRKPASDLSSVESIRNVELYQHIKGGNSGDHISLYIPVFSMALSLMVAFNTSKKILLTLHFDKIHCSGMADQSAGIPLDKVQDLIPHIRSLLSKGHHITMKFGYALKFKVKLEELSVACWQGKIAAHQAVRHLDGLLLNLT